MSETKDTVPWALGLVFEPVRSDREIPPDKPPVLSLSPPSAGWIRWQIGEGDGALVIRMSDVYPPLVPLWVWAAAVAHRLLPVTLRVDEEGVHTDLCAEAEGASDLRLTVLQFDAHGDEYRRLVWREARLGWLNRIGETFGGYLGESFDVGEWCLGAEHWPEPAQYLPWVWPATVARYRAAHNCDWPAPAQRAWFFLGIACRLNPFALRRAWCPDDQEAFARLRFQLTWLRRAAVDAASGAMDVSIQYPAVAALDERLSAALDLFEELEMQRETGWIERPELAEAREREHALHRLAFGFESALHALVSEATETLFDQLPLAPGAWLADEHGRAGRILQSDGLRMIIDWGEIGLSTECGPNRCYRVWPIMAPDGFQFPDDPLFRRWRTFATEPPTAGYLVCPCCGYPDLEEDSDEIMDCPLCGWPLFLLLSRSLPDPEQPLFSDSSGDPETWPSLAESRRHFAEHGDAFPLDDEERTRWLRRPDVADLRRRVIADFDAWLDDPLHATQVLPQDNWEQLDRMPRNPLGDAGE